MPLSEYRNCPFCSEELPDDFLISAGASARSRARPPEKRRGTRPVLTPCPWCKEPYTSTEMRLHRTCCEARPEVPGKWHPPSKTEQKKRRARLRAMVRERDQKLAAAGEVLKVRRGRKR